MSDTGEHKAPRKGKWLFVLTALLLVFVIAAAGCGNTPSVDRFKGIEKENPVWVGYCDTMAWAIYGDLDYHGSGEQWEAGAKLAKSDLAVGYSTLRSDKNIEDLNRAIRTPAQMLLELPPEQVDRSEANALWQKYYMRAEAPPEEKLPTLEPTIIGFAFAVAINVNDIPIALDNDSLNEPVMNVGRDMLVLTDKTGKYFAVNAETEKVLPFAYFIGKPDLLADRDNPHLYLFADSYDESGNLLYRASDGSLQQSGVVGLMLTMMQIEVDETAADTTTAPAMQTTTAAPATALSKAGFDKWDFIVWALDSGSDGIWFGVHDMVPYALPAALIDIEEDWDGPSYKIYNPDGTEYKGSLWAEGEYMAWSKGEDVRWDNNPEWQTAKKLAGFDYD